jgi:hypothetical protein
MRLMIWAYFDESGKLLNADDFICLCGYLGDEHWEGFTEQWGMLLRQHNLPSLHMAPLLSRKGSYQHIKWDDDQQRDVLRQFIAPIKKNTAAFFSVSLDAKHYRAMPREAREAFGQKTALDFSFQRLIKLVTKQLQTWNLDIPISMNFDYEEQFSLICLRSLAKLRSHYPEVKKLIGAITFCDSNVYYPLQAADMLAYGTYQHLHGKTLDYFQQMVLTPDQVGPFPSSEHYSAESLDWLWGKLKNGEIERF